MKAGILGLWMKKKYGTPYLVTEHWAIYNGEAPDAFLKRNIFFRRMTKSILRHCSLFTPVSHNLGEAVQKMVVDIPFTVVPNAVDTRFFNYEEGWRKNKDPFTFLHVSTLNYQKNPEAILRAYRQFALAYPNSKLILAGHAGDALLQYAASLNIPYYNIRFTGLVSYGEVAALMKGADALLMFSRYENLPCVITEAQCCGLPVISTDAGGIGEVVNNTNGILLHGQDEDKLPEAMTELFNNYARFSNAGIAGKAVQAFSYNATGKTIAELYMKLSVPKHIVAENKQHDKEQ
jgi:glycosyltransferase involved in cell wall biosynthesis